MGRPSALSARNYRTRRTSGELLPARVVVEDGQRRQRGRSAYDRSVARKSDVLPHDFTPRLVAFGTPGAPSEEVRIFVRQYSSRSPSVCSNGIVIFHPTARSIFDGSPSRIITSEGRNRTGSTLTAMPLTRERPSRKSSTC